jgi:hypothetical protein
MTVVTFPVREKSTNLSHPQKYILLFMFGQINTGRIKGISVKKPFYRQTRAAAITRQNEE